ncbi:MAG TPA: glutaminyl-peptide cyclotransferase [Ferruginibacter sp.]|nr:glutaminyl-peptide cyclotransferase [Ferruginibacter sp.]
MKKYFPLVSIILLAACNGGDHTVVDPELQKEVTPAIAYTIIAQYPHDTSAYTEGLQVYDGKFYEGTGMENESTRQVSDIKTGKVEQRYLYTDPKIFGEGIQVFKGKVYQLTWKNHIVYVYDVKNLKDTIKTFNWPYEGWGMTNNGTDLIISDGSPVLYFVDPETFKEKSRITVHNNSGSVGSINELEYINGFIYSNVWQTDDILKIDPADGKVVGKISLTDLKQQYFANQITDRTDVLNGIAYDSTTRKMYITGKRWPSVFEIKLQ